MSYIQYGCGLCAPDGWMNFDGSPTLRLQRLPLLGLMVRKVRFPKNVLYGDIVAGLPVKDQSAKAVYCSHVLEHLALADFRTAVRNTFRMLAPGGQFRMVLPDLEYVLRRYFEDTQPGAALRFMKESLFGQETRPRTIRAFLSSWLGNADHRWMWD